MVFADGGIDAPLHAVAKTAGVGQGSLYRHFPDRISLALAVFEENVAQLEALAADPKSTLDDLLTLMTEMTIESVAFVEIVSPVPDEPRLIGIVRRVEAAIAATLPEAHRSGAVRRTVRVEEVMLAVSLVSALLAKVAPDRRRETADSAWALLRRALRP